LLIGVTQLPMVFAGTVAVGIDLIIRDSNSAPRAAGSVTYKSIFGTPTSENVDVTSHISGTSATWAGPAATPFNFSYEGSEPVSPPNCYQAFLYAVADDSSADGHSSQICIQGPPPPPPPPIHPDPGPGGCIVNCDGGTFDASGIGTDPLLVDLQGAYKLSGLDDAVAFDINAVGHRQLIGWTARGSGIAFVALDRNGNGQIDDGGELFGNATPLSDGVRAQNGFEALAQYDSNGDGIIDSQDRIWNQLLLWTDTNHNGVSEQGELTHVSDSSITAFEVSYRTVGRRDQFWNYLRYEGHLREAHRSHTFYDAFFVISK
jgi:hypothetical protein